MLFTGYAQIYIEQSRLVANLMRYLPAGCNGVGKTTADFTLLPGLLACREFMNSPIKPTAYLWR